MLKHIKIAIGVLFPLLSGCPEFESVKQPQSARPFDTVDVEISVMSDGNYSIADFGILLPDGWKVVGDSIKTYGALEATLYGQKDPSPQAG